MDPYWKGNREQVIDNSIHSQETGGWTFEDDSKAG